jgi:hypothetical protein
MKEELYDDIIEKEPDVHAPEKEQRVFTERLRKSIGWVEPVEKEYKEGKKKKKELVWDVVTGEGEAISFDDEEHAWIYSEMIQMNKRLKRMEGNGKR